MLNNIGLVGIEGGGDGGGVPIPDFSGVLDRVMVGDSVELLRSFPSGVVDLILTDPPYMISKEVRISRGRNRGRWSGKDIDLHFGDWDEQWSSVDEYLVWCRSWLGECFRILRRGGHLVMFFDKFKISHIIEYAESSGMIGRQCLFYLKSNPVPQARKVRFMEAFELAIWLTKGTTSREYATFHYELGQSPNYIVHSIVQGRSQRDGMRYHPTQKPVVFGEWVISYLSNEGDVVLDPFCGSGSFLVAAKRLGRRYIGIDKDRGYVEFAESRLKLEDNLFMVEE